MLFSQAAACAFLAQLISETTNSTKRGVGQGTQNDIDSSIKKRKSFTEEKNKFIYVQKVWVPTEKIIKMWIPALKGIKASSETDLGSDSAINLSQQRMRASVQSDSLQVCFRLSKEEYY